MNNRKELLAILSELSKALRCCQQDAVFCEEVTFSQFMILDAVSSSGLLRLSDLHGILSVDKSTSTRLIKPLADRGLLIREKSAVDSRAFNLRLSEEGKEVHAKVLQCLSGVLDSVEELIPEKKREEVLRAVRIFLTALQKACVMDQCCPRTPVRA